MSSDDKINPFIRLFYYNGLTYYTDAMFEELWNLDRHEFIRIIFYLRHHRKIMSIGNPNLIDTGINYVTSNFNGRGKRKIFYQVLIWMSKYKLNHLIPLLAFIPDYGYWKDLLILMGTSAEPDIVRMFSEQLRKDYDSFHRPVPGLISMVAKWTPNENSAIDRKYKMNTKICNYLQITHKKLRIDYLVPLRRYLMVTEQFVSAKKWPNINYNHVSELSLRKHTESFMHHDNKRFVNFLNETYISFYKRLSLPLSVQSYLTGTNGLIIEHSPSAYYAIDKSIAMIGLPLIIAASLCIESGTLLWIPFKYSEEAIPINKCEYQLVTGTTFNEKVDNIVKSQCDTYDLETCIDMGSDSEHLIIITNSLFADLEILPKLKGTSTHVTIWSFNINHVVINEVSPKLTLIEGYNIYVYLQLMGGLKITASDYMNKVLSLPHFKIITV